MQKGVYLSSTYQAYIRLYVEALVLKESKQKSHLIDFFKIFLLCIHSILLSIYNAFPIEIYYSPSLPNPDLLNQLFSQPCKIGIKGVFPLACHVKPVEKVWEETLKS